MDPGNLSLSGLHLASGLNMCYRSVTLEDITVFNSMKCLASQRKKKHLIIKLYIPGDPILNKWLEDRYNCARGFSQCWCLYLSDDVQGVLT